MTSRTPVAGSPSLAQPDYWWYRARAGMLAAFFGPYLHPGDRMLDVGSADGPSLAWVDGGVRRVPLDLDPRGLAPGVGVTGDLMRLPFRDEAFDVVGAFDVLEHCDPESVALAETRRVLRPGGHALLTVPAYTWAWTSHDEHNAHLRRYTRPRLERAVTAAGLEVVRSSYAFAGVFPAFAAQRLATRLTEWRAGRRGAGPASAQDVVTVPRVPPTGERALLTLCAVDRWALRRTDLPFGSSVFAVAVRRG